VEFVARERVAEHLIQIVLEGIRNTRQHARARTATIDVRDAAEVIRMTIDDDGIGVNELKAPPWTIASRVAELGGRLVVKTDIHPGAHFEMEIPTA
jgi:signal transduction histidine kinase